MVILIPGSGHFKISNTVTQTRKSQRKVDWINTLLHLQTVNNSKAQDMGRQQVWRNFITKITMIRDYNHSFDHSVLLWRAAGHVLKQPGDSSKKCVILWTTRAHKLIIHCFTHSCFTAQLSVFFSPILSAPSQNFLLHPHTHSCYHQIVHCMWLVL